MKEKTFLIVFVLLSFFVSKSALAQDGIPVITYSLNGESDNVIIDPTVNPLQIDFLSDENIENWVSITIKNNDDTTIYKTFQPGSSCDGTFQCSQLWDGAISPSDKSLIDGIYSITVHIKNTVEPTFDLTLTSPYTIQVDTSTLEQPILSSIAITNPANKLDYLVGDELDITGLEVTGIYSDDSTNIEIITIDDVTGFDSTAPTTDQVLTITVGEQTVTYTININSASNEEPIETKNIILKVYAGDEVLFDGPETITACPESPEIDAPVTFNGKCAVEQSGLTNTWTWYDSNFSTTSDLPKTLGILDELGGSASDNTNYIYWGWFSDLNYGSTALNKHILLDDEELLLTYNSYPLRISADTTPGTMGDTTVFTAEEKSSFNDDWSDMVWTLSEDVLINFGDQSCTTIEDGTCSIVTNAAGSFEAIGSKTLYVPSSSLSIEVIPVASGGNSGSSTPEPVIFSVSDANSFLSGNQAGDGSFGSMLYTDWVAISASASNSSFKSSLKDFLLNNDLNSSIVTDNERHAMALMSLGISPYDGTSVNYIEKIVNFFDGTQIGDSSLINDDIFGLIVLANAGYKVSDEIISTDVSYVLSNQDSDGSWGGTVDMTSAGIQALHKFTSLSDVSLAITKAENYITQNQGSDGGFQNNSSTSWALQALSLNLSLSTNITNADSYLADGQQADGGMEDISSDVSNRVWSTAYAIPAVLHMSWSDIMDSFSKPKNTISTSSGGTSSTIDSEPILEEEVICPEGDLFSAVTGQPCTVFEKVDSTNELTVVIPNPKEIKPGVPKVETKTEKNNDNNTEDYSDKIQNNSLGSNLTASAAGATSNGIAKSAFNSVVNFFAYIGKGFLGFFSFVFGS